jgi:hypothetical protein
MIVQLLFDLDLPDISEKEPVDIESYLKRVNPDRVCPVCGNDFIEYGIKARVWIKGNKISLVQVLDDPKPWISCVGCGKVSPLDTVESE